MYLQVQAEITTKHVNSSGENTLYFRSSEKPTTLLTKDLTVVHQSPTFYLFLRHFFLFPFHLFPCPACNVHNLHTLSQGLSVNNPCKNTFCQLQPRRAVSESSLIPMLQTHSHNNFLSRLTTCFLFVFRCKKLQAVKSLCVVPSASGKDLPELSSLPNA